VAVFNEKFQNIEKSKASIVEVVSCLATVKATIQEIIKCTYQTKLNQHWENSSEGKDRDCDLCMSDVSVLCKPCVAYLDKWSTL